MTRRILFCEQPLAIVAMTDGRVESTTMHFPPAQARTWAAEQVRASALSLSAEHSADYAEVNAAELFLELGRVGLSFEAAD